jgi:hypothetical protein
MWALSKSGAWRPLAEILAILHGQIIVLMANDGKALKNIAMHRPDRPIAENKRFHPINYEIRTCQKSI